MRLHKSIIRVLGTLLLLAAPGLPLLSNSTNRPAGSLRGMEQLIHQYVNQERKSLGVPVLVWSEQVAAEARRHAKNIAEGRTFTHADPLRGNIDLRLDKSGIDWRRCAENLYEANFGDPARDAVQAWLNSPGHRTNLMDSMFSDAGVGVAQRSDGWIIVVQEYIQK